MKRLSLRTCVVLSACATAHPNMNQIAQREPIGVELRGVVVGTDGVPFPVWLPAGNDIFQLKPNGSIPTVSLSPGIIPEPVTIVLEQRGGEVELRVFDRATTSHVEAGLGISRSRVEGHTFGSMSIRTGENGSSHTVFLPPGDYEVTIFSYPCGTRTYFTQDPTKTIVTVIEGQRVGHTIQIDVRELDAKESYGNLDGKKCVL